MSLISLMMRYVNGFEFMLWLFVIGDWIEDGGEIWGCVECMLWDEIDIDGFCVGDVDGEEFLINIGLEWMGIGMWYKLWNFFCRVVLEWC